MALKTKIGKSDIQGKGLLANMQLSAGSDVGVSHVDDWPTEEIGAFYNHSETPNAMSIKNGKKRNVVVMKDVAPGEEITLDYRKQPELEQPEDFKAMGLLKMMAGRSVNL
jgi:hypothetical protein